METFPQLSRSPAIKTRTALAADPTLRDAMQSGAEATVLQFPRGRRQWDVTIEYLTWDDAGMLEDFVRLTACYGANPFFFPDNRNPRNPRQRQVRFSVCPTYTDAAAEEGIRQTTIIDNLTPGCYDTKVVNNGSGAVFNPIDHFEHESNLFGDQLWVESCQETSYTTLAYPNSIQVVLRIMASDQISGADLNLQADITFGLRSTLPAALSNLAEDNPAAVACDICSDDVIGMGLPDSRIDLDWLSDVGALSNTQVDNGDGGTQNLARFNGIFDQANVSC